MTLENETENGNGECHSKMAFENKILNANVKCHGKFYWKMHWKIPLEKFI
jgi:hypothetical protein